MKLTAKLGRVCALAMISSVAAMGCGDDGVNHLPDGPPPTDAMPPPGPAVLMLSQASADFGSVVNGQSSGSMTITVANVGKSESGAITPAISGGQGSNFVVSGTTCTTLASAATCTVDLKFNPNGNGTKTASLVVSSAPGGTVMASLQGTGIAPGALTITPSTNQFTNVVVGATSATSTTFTVTNTGGTATGALVTTSSGSDAGQFAKSADTCNGQTLAAAGTCTITVGFSPTSAGPKFATYTVTGSPGGAVAASVNGLALSDAQLVLNPTSQNFGTVVTGSSSSDVTLTLINIGGVTTGAIQQTLAGTNAGSFTVVSSACANAQLAPGTSCQAVVRFSPTATGVATATLSFAGTPGGSQTVNLTGTGVVGGLLVIAPTTRSFGNLTVGQTSATQSFTITNTGGVASGTISTTLTGQDPSQFSVTANGCLGQTLAPGGMCTITARFQPGSAGAKSALINGAAAPGGSVSAALNGNGIPAAAIALTPAAHDFGSVAVNDTTGVQVFTLTNVGGSATGVPAISLSGANPTQFTSTSTCASALQPLQTCAISVRFSPTTLGSDVASLDVVASPGGAAAANLFGEGVSAAALSVNPSSITFPDIVAIGDTSLPTDCNGEGGPCPDPQFVVTNNGTQTTGPLTITMTGVNAADFAVTSTTCSVLGAGQTCVVQVHFTPTGRGDRVASARVSGTPGGTVSVALSGVAEPRIEIIDVSHGEGDHSLDNPFDYGDTTVNISYPFYFDNELYVTVRNNTAEDAYLDVDGINLDSFDHGGNGEFIEDYNSCNSIIIEGGGGGFATAAKHTQTVAQLRAANAARAKARKASKHTISKPAKKTTRLVSKIVGGFQDGTIFAHGTCQVGFLFVPSAAGPKTGSAVFSIGPTVLDQATENLLGNGRDSLYFSLTPGGDPASTFDFGNVATGGTSPAKAVYLQNRSDGSNTGPLQLQALQFAQFGSTTNCVPNQSLAGGQSCVITLRFSPSTLGPDHATIAASASPGGTPSFEYTGTGVNPQGLILNPTPVVFGNVLDGMTKTVTVTVTNPAGAQTSGGFFFSLGSDSCGGGGSGSGSAGSGSNAFACFSLLVGDAADCQNGATIAGGTTCNIRVQFNTGNGQQGQLETATLFASASPGLPSEGITVSGTVQSTVSISPSGTIALGNVQKGSPVQRTLTVRNDSPAAVTLGQQIVGGTSTDLSTVGVDGCANATIPSNGTCTVTFKFDPQADSEPLNATLAYTTTDNNGTARVAITGTGHAPNFQFTESFPVNAPLVLGSTNAPTASHQLTLTNTGTGRGSVASLTVSGDTAHFSVSADSCTGVSLGANVSCTVTLNHVGPCSGASTAQLTAVVPNDGSKAVNATGCVSPN